MTRTVHCRKYAEDLPGLQAPPLPGPKGEELFQTVSQKAWSEWQTLQTMLINEKHLDMRDPQARKYLAAQREKFLDNEPVDRAEGYVQPDDTGPPGAPS
jgi:Fe-S cluster biosynthesis and repair protein YggX